MTRITATEASRNFSDVLSRAQYQGESFEVERSGRVVACITPAQPARRPGGKLADLLKLYELRSGDPSFADDLERAQRSGNEQVPENPWER